MNEEQLHKILSEGIQNHIKPALEQISMILSDLYIQGFKDCWKLFTGEEIKDD